NVAGPPEELAPPGAIAMLGVAASAIARRFRLRGLFGIDFLLSDGIPAILEVNPRYSASMELLEQISALNLLDMHLRALDGGPARLWGASGSWYAARDPHAQFPRSSSHERWRGGERDGPGDGEHARHRPGDSTPSGGRGIRRRAELRERRRGRRTDPRRGARP